MSQYYFYALNAVEHWESYDDKNSSGVEEFLRDIELVLRYEDTGIITEIGFDQEEDNILRDKISKYLFSYKNRTVIRAEISRDRKWIRRFLELRDGRICAGRLYFNV